MKNPKQSPYLHGDEQIRDFPTKYNRLVRTVENLTWTVLLLGVAVVLSQIVIFYPGIVGYIIDLLGAYTSVLVAICVTVGGTVLAHIIIKKYIDPLLAEENKI